MRFHIPNPIEIRVALQQPLVDIQEKLAGVRVSVTCLEHLRTAYRIAYRIDTGEGKLWSVMMPLDVSRDKDGTWFYGGIQFADDGSRVDYVAILDDDDRVVAIRPISIQLVEEGVVTCITAQGIHLPSQSKGRVDPDEHLKNLEAVNADLCFEA